MMVILGFLPPPPGTSSESGPSLLEVVLIVVAILGAVTLIAWLLKPMVAKRLRAATPMTTVGENGTVPESRQWHDSWQATRERDAEQQDSVPESADQVLLPSKASDDDVIENETPEAEASSLDAVSYTHLTLPTKRIV